MLSFLLFTYNQEEFVREAVMAALNQDYSPLEIIISDDCSTDGTFAIIEEITESYTGPHRLVVRRNPVNLGWIAHVNEIARTATGEWIIMAAGDDISQPSRASLVEKIASECKHAKSIFLGIQTIGVAIGFMDRPKHTPGMYSFPDTVETNGAVGLGAAQAWNRDIFNVFGKLPIGLHREDAILPFRASLLGCIVVDERPGVVYRISSDSLSRGYFKIADSPEILKVRQGEIAELQCMLSDLEVAKKLPSQNPELLDASLPLIQRMLRTAECQVLVLQGCRFKRILNGIRILLGLPGYNGLCGNFRFRIQLFLNGFRPNRISPKGKSLK